MFSAVSAQFLLDSIRNIDVPTETVTLLNVASYLS